MKLQQDWSSQKKLLKTKTVNFPSTKFGKSLAMLMKQAILETIFLTLEVTVAIETTVKVLVVVGFEGKFPIPIICPGGVAAEAAAVAAVAAAAVIVALIVAVVAGIVVALIVAVVATAVIVAVAAGAAAVVIIVAVLVEVVAAVGPRAVVAAAMTAVAGAISAVSAAVRAMLALEPLEHPLEATSRVRTCRGEGTVQSPKSISCRSTKPC